MYKNYCLKITQKIELEYIRITVSHFQKIIKNKMFKNLLHQICFVWNGVGVQIRQNKYKSQFGKCWGQPGPAGIDCQKFFYPATTFLWGVHQIQILYVYNYLYKYSSKTRLMKYILNESLIMMPMWWHICSHQGILSSVFFIFCTFWHLSCDAAPASVQFWFGCTRTRKPHFCKQLQFGTCRLHPSRKPQKKQNSIFS